MFMQMIPPAYIYLSVRNILTLTLMGVNWEKLCGHNTVCYPLVSSSSYVGLRYAEKAVTILTHWHYKRTLRTFGGKVFRDESQLSFQSSDWAEKNPSRASNLIFKVTWTICFCPKPWMEPSLAVRNFEKMKKIDMLSSVCCHRCGISSVLGSRDGNAEFVQEPVIPML